MPEQLKVEVRTDDLLGTDILRLSEEVDDELRSQSLPSWVSAFLTYHGMNQYRKTKRIYDKMRSTITFTQAVKVLILSSLLLTTAGCFATTKPLRAKTQVTAQEARDDTAKLKNEFEVLSGAAIEAASDEEDKEVLRTLFSEFDTKIDDLYIKTFDVHKDIQEHRTND